MKQLCALILLCTLALSLFACGKTADTDTPDTVVLTNVYKLTAPNAQGYDNAYYTDAYVSGDTLYLSQGLNTKQLYAFDGTGTLTQTASVSLSEEDLSLRQVFPIENGYFGFAENMETQTYFLVLCDFDGTVLAKTEPESADTQSIAGVANGAYYLVDNTTITVYDENLEPVKTIQLRFVPLSFRTVTEETGTDRVYLMDLNGSLYVLDTEKGSTETVFPSQSTMTAGFPGSGYDWYYLDENGIYGMSGATQTMLCGFGNSFLSFTDIKAFYALSPDRFFIRYGDSPQSSKYMFLVPAEETVERVPLRIAWLSYGSNHLSLMRNIANDFNQSGTQYAVELVNYGKYGELYEKENSTPYQQFQKDLMAGEVYDLYAISAYHFGALFSSMEKNGTFADLTELYDDVLPGVRKAFETESGIFGLPYAITYQFLMTPADRGSSLDAMIDTAQGCLAQEDVILTDRDFTGEMVEVYAHSLGDMDFDTPQFTTFLEALKLFCETTDNRYGYLSTVSYDTYKELRPFTGGSKYWDMLRADHIKYAGLPLSGTELLGVYKRIYNVPAKMTGFPTADGKDAAYSNVSTLLAVPNNGNIAGAREFLRYYLSDAVQNDSFYLSLHFPLTESALAAATTARHFEYTIDQFGAIHISKTTSQTPSEAELLSGNVVSLTDAEVESFRDLIRTAVVSTGRDDMVTQIIAEELEPFFAGDRTAEDTAKIIQKRTSIYLAE